MKNLKLFFWGTLVLLSFKPLLATDAHLEQLKERVNTALDLVQDDVKEINGFIVEVQTALTELGKPDALNTIKNFKNDTEFETAYPIMTGVCNKYQ